VAIDPGLVVSADPTALERIVGNLVANALRYGRAARGRQRPAQDNHLRLRVRDHRPRRRRRVRPRSLRALHSQQAVAGTGRRHRARLAIARAYARAHQRRPCSTRQPPTAGAASSWCSAELVPLLALNVAPTAAPASGERGRDDHAGAEAVPCRHDARPRCHDPSRRESPWPAVRTITSPSTEVATRPPSRERSCSRPDAIPATAGEPRHRGGRDRRDDEDESDEKSTTPGTPRSQRSWRLPTVANRP